MARSRSESFHNFPRATRKKHNTMGYWPGETMDDVMHRFKVMLELKLTPYPMVFDNKNTELKKFQRWVIRRYYQFIPWEIYDPQNIPDKVDKKQIDMFAVN